MLEILSIFGGAVAIIMLAGGVGYLYSGRKERKADADAAEEFNKRYLNPLRSPAGHMDDARAMHNRRMYIANQKVRRAGAKQRGFVGNIKRFFSRAQPGD